jgi:hypothetical protein
MLIQIRGEWVMVAAKAKPSEAKRVAEKVAKRECLVPDCDLGMVACGLCRQHYDGAEHLIKTQPDSEAKAKAREKLIRDGLMLAPWQLPRRENKRSKSAVFRAAIAG